MATVTAYSQMTMNNMTAINYDKYKTIDSYHIQSMTADGHYKRDFYGANLNNSKGVIIAIHYSKDGNKLFDVSDVLWNYANFPKNATPEQERIYMFSGNDTFNGSAQNDVIRSFSGNDKLYGNDGNDNLDGGTGNDNLSGGNGNDSLNASDGNDSLSGGNGRDVLTGGKGADTFYYTDTTTHTDSSESGVTATTRDIILDFKHSEGDKLFFAPVDQKITTDPFPFGFGSSTTTTITHHFTFIGSGNFTGAYQLRFDSATHILYANYDGGGAPECSIQLTGVTSLQASDFSL